MTDYAGNTHKDKDPKKKPVKNIEKVVVGEVIVQKKPLRRKFKDLIIEADFKSVVKYVIHDVLLPAARNMIVDASTKGVERMVYGESAYRRRSIYGNPTGPRITYNSPISRSMRDPRLAPPVEIGPRRSSRQERGDIILSSRDEAELVLERMNDIIERYEVATVSDLHDLLGLPSSHVDEKWGWIYLTDVQVRPMRDGYWIDLPEAEPLP